MIFVNHSVEDHQLGAVNGLGQTVAAGARSFGPAAGGLLWSLSAQVHFIFINYFCAVAIFLLLHYTVSQLPQSIDGAKRKFSSDSSYQGPEYESVASLLLATADGGEESASHNVDSCDI
jgi:hypothetical protein